MSSWFRFAARLVARVFAWLSALDPIRLVTLGYVSYCLLGGLFLLLPWAQEKPGAVGALDHLFIAVSAVSTTGLVTVSPADTYTFFGELVVLVLIQLGGLGYMTVGSCILLSATGRIAPFREGVGRAALSLPESFAVGPFLRLVVLSTLVIEAVGAAALYPSFAARGVGQPVWQAVFHSVSAFCTAGFGLHNDSFESFRADAWLQAVIIVLSVLGAIGFIVLADVWRGLLGRGARMTLTSRLILWATFWIIGVGTVLFAQEEPTLSAAPAGERWLASLFQVMSASTTVGFNTIPVGALSAASVMVLTVAMMIGASPAGTGGGIKTTGLSALWGVMMASVMRRPHPTFLGREIPEVRVRTAVAQALFYVFTLATGVYVLALTERAPLPDLFFEGASALGTVGLSRGITGGLSDQAKVVVIALMFVGRAGPLALGMAFFRARRKCAASEESVGREVEDIAT